MHGHVQADFSWPSEPSPKKTQDPVSFVHRSNYATMQSAPESGCLRAWGLSRR